MANRFLSNIKINDAYTFPASDGTNGQVIKTDGSGNLSFAQLAADSASVMYKDTFTGNGSTTAFTLANALNDEVQSNVYIDGVYQSKSTYSVSGTTLTFSTAPASGHEIEVISTTGINSGPTAIYTDTFTANGSAAAFTLGQTVHDENQTIVFLNGVYQFKGTYTLSGTTLTLDAAPANGVAIEVMSIGSAYSGGDILYDHDFGSAGLMTTNGSGVYSITANNSSNWNTAYGWGDHSAQSYATQSYVGTQIANLVDSSPSTLNTLNELAAALGDDPNFATTTANSIGTKMPLAGGTFTGNVSLIKNSSSTGSSTSPKILIYNEGSGDSALQLSVSGSIDYYLGVDNSDDKFKIGGSSWDSSPYLTINTSGNATFAGDSYVTGSSNSNVVISRDNMYIDAGQLYIGADDAATDDTFRQRTASGSYFIESRKSGTWTNRLQINTAGTLIAGQGATFAGTVTFHDHTTHPDQVGARFGTDSDTVFQHNGSHFFMDNFTGTTYIRNTGANSSGIIIRNGNVGDIEIDNEVAANIKFNTSNIERMRIGSNGYVGMGMDNNNNQRLALAQADANGSHIRMNNSRSGGGYFVMGVGDSGSTSSITPAGGLFFYNGATRMVIDSSGNVGIGTTSPQTTLDIKGAASALNAHFGQGTNNSSGVFGGISLGYSEAGNASYRKVGIVAKAIGDGAARQELHFLVDTNADGGSAGIADSKMMINTSGNVGIGTSSPSEILHLNEAGQTGCFIRFQNTGGSGVYIGGRSEVMEMYTNGSEKMRITSGGNVGIGETSPGTLLSLKGGADTSIITLKCTKNDASWGGNTIGAIYFYSEDGSGPGAGIRGSINYFATSSSGGDTAMSFKTGDNTERLRITNGGQIEIRNGTTVAGQLKPSGSDNDLAINGKRGQVIFEIADVQKAVLDANQFYPAANNGLNLGTTSLRFSTVFATNGVNTSDETLKENIKECDLGIDFIDLLKPKSYNLKDLREDNDAYDKKRYGLIAQDLLQTELKDSVFGEKDGEYGLSYNDLIAPMIKAIQELKADNDSLRARIETLENN